MPSDFEFTGSIAGVGRARELIASCRGSLASLEHSLNPDNIRAVVRSAQDAVLACSASGPIIGGPRDPEDEMVAESGDITAVLPRVLKRAMKTEQSLAGAADQNAANAALEEVYHLHRAAQDLLFTGLGKRAFHGESLPGVKVEMLAGHDRGSSAAGSLPATQPRLEFRDRVCSIMKSHRLSASDAVEKARAEHPEEWEEYLRRSKEETPRVSAREPAVTRGSDGIASAGADMPIGSLGVFEQRVAALCRADPTLTIGAAVVQIASRPENEEAHRDWVSRRCPGISCTGRASPAHFGLGSALGGIGFETVVKAVMQRNPTLTKAAAVLAAAEHPDHESAHRGWVDRGCPAIV